MEQLIKGRRITGAASLVVTTAAAARVMVRLRTLMKPLLPLRVLQRLWVSRELLRLALLGGG